MTPTIEFLGKFVNKEIPEKSTGGGEVLKTAVGEIAMSPDRPEVRLVVWHGWDTRMLSKLLEKRPNAKVLVVGHGGPTYGLVANELQQAIYGENRKRVRGCTESRSVPGYLRYWDSLVDYFSGGEPTEDVTRFLGLEQPVRLMALCAGLEVAKRELERDPPRIGMEKLLEPALKLATDAGRNDVHEQISIAIAAKVSDVDGKKEARDAVEKALTLLRKEATN